MTTQRDTALDLRAKTDTGTAELIADRGHPGSWTLEMDGVAQSYVDLNDPRRLEMMYVRMVASVIDSVADGRLRRALHLGAGGLSLPRYLAATRPGCEQLVVELDRGLLELVRFGLPVPDDSHITFRLSDAREAVESLAASGFDLIVNDVYTAARMPTPVSGTRFAQQVARLLAPGGLYVVNVLDSAGLMGTRRQLATVRTCFADTCVLSTARMWKGKRDGNLVIVAAAEPGTISVGRIKAAARPRLDLVARTGDALDTFLSGTAPLVD